MRPPLHHALHQLPALAATGKTVLAAWRQRLRPVQGPLHLPGPVLHATLPPLPPDLVEDFLRHVGADPAPYAGRLPPTLWPQWGWALAQDALRDIPYPLLRVLNGGCRLEQRAPLPRGVPLQVQAQLQSLDDNERRVLLRAQVTTGTAAVPEALVAQLVAIIPKRRTPSAPREEALVPAHAQEVERWTLPADAGLGFALLTGDFNPIHWLTPYARLAGFPGRILHGFSTMARTWEALARRGPLRTLDVRFTRPLGLPAQVGLYRLGQDVAVGAAPGAPAVMLGSCEG